MGPRQRWHSEGESALFALQTPICTHDEHSIAKPRRTWTALELGARVTRVELLA